MLASKLFINTTKKSDADLISQQLMQRAGLIKQVASGIYIFLPIGLKIIAKIETIIREEINKIGGLEVILPLIQPSSLWKESGRWDFYGAELLRLKDRHEQDFCVGPTHEEVVVEMLRGQLNSYKQLPIIIYQIQTKFRDERRPRFGIIRAREFIMKDAYSFHEDKESLKKTYHDMYGAYSAIFTRIGLNFVAVDADTGSIGGSNSHEFQALSDIGEDIIAYTENGSYAANIELAKAKQQITERLQPTEELTLIVTEEHKSCDDVAKFLNVSNNKIVKSLLYIDAHKKPILILLNAIHELNETKLNHLNLAQPLTLASAEEIKQYCFCDSGAIGPIHFNAAKQTIEQFNGMLIVDNDVINMHDFICGSNINGYHLKGVNFERDIKAPDVIADIRNVIEGDLSLDGDTIKLRKGIEIGHIFQLGTKYSESMNLTFQNADGNNKNVEMGCYGIGVSRIIATIIEQSHDTKGIIWPMSIAPFHLVIIPLQYYKNDAIKKLTDEIYDFSKNLNLDVLLDDRDLRLGSILADSELIGFPYRVIIGNDAINTGLIELYTRKDDNTIKITIQELKVKLTNLLK